MSKALKIAALMTSAALLPTMPALAQDSGQSDRETPSGRQAQVPSQNAQSGLSEIVVTAQKREDNLQDTPLAVSAITSEQIVAQGIADAADLTAIAPNLSSTKTTSATSNIALFIRGIGEADPILTIDSPIGLYVDGIIVGRSAGAAFDIVDLERIEVLRGPQGTLYGRNTTGGTVNLITKRPTREFGIDILGSYGNLDYLQGRVTLNTGEFGDSGVAASISYLHKERDGYADDLNSPDSQDPGAYDTDALRASLQFDRGGDFRANYTFSYNETKSYAVPFQLATLRPDIAAALALSPALGGSEVLVGIDQLDAIRLEDGQITDEVTGHTLTLEADLTDNITVKSLSGYRKWENTANGGDLDGNDGLRAFTVSPAILAPPFSFIPTGVQEIELFTAENEREQDQFSQEINILGEYDRFNFVLGGYFFTEESMEDNPQFFTIFIPSPVPIPLGPGLVTNSIAVPAGTRVAYEHESESFALFGQATVDLTDRLSVTGGLRYTKDEKTLRQTAPLTRTLKRDFSEFTYAGTIDYDFDDLLVYARIASGYKAGGFNARSANDGFEPETIVSYEAGLKSELLNNTLRFNLALFYADYTDVQIQQFQAGSGGATSVTVNAGSATYQGIEAEVVAVPVTGLTLSGQIGYVDRDYQEFLFRDPTTNQLVDVADEAGFRYSPDITAHASAQYEFPPFDFGQFTVRADYSYVGDRAWDALDARNPRAQLIADDPYHTLDLRASLGEIDVGGGEATIALWGRNVLDEEYQNSGIDFGGLGFGGISYAEGATYGVDVRLNF